MEYFLLKNNSPVLFYTCRLEADWEILTVLLEGKTPLKRSIPANSRNRILEICLYRLWKQSE